MIWKAANKAGPNNLTLPYNQRVPQTNISALENILLVATRRVRVKINTHKCQTTYVLNSKFSIGLTESYLFFGWGWGGGGGGGGWWQ